MQSQPSQLQLLVDTIKYSDIFDFPLTLNEIHRFYPREIHRDELQELLQKADGMNSLEYQNQTYYYLSDRQYLIPERIKRFNISQSQWEVVRKIRAVLARLPFVKMVAITGSLSVNNSTANSDIDFFVVTKARRVWLSRLLIYLVEKYLQRYKIPNIHLCFNFILSEDKLELPIQNVYVARELLQMVPILGFKFYYKVIQANDWIYSYFPNINIDHLTKGMNGQTSDYFAPPEVRGLSKFAWVAEKADRGWVKWLFNVIDYLEFKRAVAKIFRNLGPSQDARYSIDEYKAHYGNYQTKALNLEI